jgi:NAD(P)-dependent dehydrogenase (short-subunit alcohol dehydrogenase family)
MHRVIVTGGSRGIGRAIAEKCLEAGYRVHLVARCEQTLSQVAIELQTKGFVEYSAVDLSDPQQVERFTKCLQGQFYGLVNNAGFWQEDSLEKLDVGLFMRMTNVNVLAPYLLTVGLFDKIKSPGRVVNIASQLGTMGRERMGIYCATKHALVGLTRSWAPEASRKGITVNTVCPGWVDTESNRTELRRLGDKRGRTMDDEVEQITKGLILRRFIKEEEVASLVVFLMSAGASGISGQVYEIK